MKVSIIKLLPGSPLSPLFTVYIDDKIYKSVYKFEELSLWCACQHLEINALDAFASWIFASDWFPHRSVIESRRNALIDYLRHKWVFHTAQLFSNHVSYNNFVRQYHNCIANKIDKIYYCGLNKVKQ